MATPRKADGFVGPAATATAGWPPPRPAGIALAEGCIKDARSGSSFRSSRLELDATDIVATEENIDDIVLRLHSQRAVTARGMARLRFYSPMEGAALPIWEAISKEGWLRRSPRFKSSTRIAR